MSRFAICCAALLLWFAPWVATATEVLNGRYIGVQDAAGASILISPDAEGFSGTFFDPFGRSQDFDADKVGDTAEAVLDMDGALPREIRPPPRRRLTLSKPRGNLAHVDNVHSRGSQR